MHLARAARVLGLIGGIGALVWAMRDRFVTVALTRKPEHPTFSLPAEPSDSVTTEPDDLTAIDGIGPVFARRLMEAGIATYHDLAGASPAHVAEIVNIPEARAGKWIDDAVGLVKA